MIGFTDLDPKGLALARQMDPKAAEAIEGGTGWPCTIIPHYAAACLSGFADRALDAQEAT